MHFESVIGRHHHSDLLPSDCHFNHAFTPTQLLKAHSARVIYTVHQVDPLDFPLV